MLTIDPEKVCHIIVKARAIDAKEQVGVPSSGSNPTDGRMADVHEDFAGGPVRQELLEFMRSLDADEQIELVALCWLGRATYALDEWQEALSEAAAARNERTAEYLLQQPLLADYLEEGLAAFGESCEKFESRKR